MMLDIPDMKTPMARILSIRKVVRLESVPLLDIGALCWPRSVSWAKFEMAMVQMPLKIIAPTIQSRIV